MGLEADFDIMKFGQDMTDAVARGKVIATANANMRPSDRALGSFRQDIMRRVQDARADGKTSAKILHRVVRPKFGPKLNADKTARTTMDEGEHVAFGLHLVDAYAELDGDEIGDSVCHLFFRACDAAGFHVRAFCQTIRCGHEYVIIARW